MATEAFGSADEILFRASELPEPERAKYVAGACGDDHDLRREVESLLAAHERAGLFLDLPPRAAGKELEGSKIGHYRILRRIGAGGMGTVYLAERADAEFEKRVAIKLIKSGMDSEELLGRFKQERQLLADLDHPNISRLLDGGTSDEGVPYLVLEYVEGEAIDVHCSNRRLTIGERLELFLEVCGAVEFAHRALVVHRDLKPANILVDENGHAKLLDFGIAKLLGDDREVGPDLTTTGLRIMTPRYAAPEQIRRERVTTATDVFALGVVLYRLLTEQMPFAGDSLRDLERSICESQPKLPSRACADPKRGKRLVGDLDTIVLQCLQKDPQRRYSSVEQLAADLRRYRAQQPVLARTDSVGYRLGKFVRRNALAVASAGVVFVAVASAAAISSILFWRADAARLVAEAATSEAETLRRSAEEVSSFLQEMLRTADPVASQNRESMTVRAVLDQAARRIRVELASEPRVASSLLLTIGGAYENLALYELAEESLSSALELRRSTNSLDPRGEVEALVALATLATNAGDLDRADDLLREGLELARALPEKATWWTARCQLRLAAVLQDRGSFDEAEVMMKESLAGFAVTGSAEDEGRVLHDLALLFSDRGRHDEAVKAMERALARLESSLGKDHSFVVQSLNDLGWIYSVQDRHDRALPYFQQALVGYERVFSEAHPKVAIAHANLANVLRTQGQFDEAVAELELALASFRASFGADHAYVGHTLNNIGVALERKGDAVSAARRFREAGALYSKALGSDHPHVATAGFNLARALRSQGELDEAEAQCRESLEVRRRVLRPGHPDQAFNLGLLGDILLDRGDARAALASFREALTVRSRELQENNPSTAWSRVQVGIALIELGRFVEAAGHIADGQEVLLEVRGAEHPETLRAVAALDELHRRMGTADQEPVCE